MSMVPKRYLPIFVLLVSCPMFDATVDASLHASSMSLRASFIVPAICFTVVGLYALIFSKSNKE